MIQVRVLVYRDNDREQGELLVDRIYRISDDPSAATLCHLLEEVSSDIITCLDSTLETLR